ncbi:MAG: hypothetical protein HY272_03175 [Gammaproteobacteria bacterium]|nr:hypothetical protein [Gammaproteobacteria bacterium]
MLSRDSQLLNDLGKTGLVGIGLLIYTASAFFGYGFSQMDRLDEIKQLTHQAESGLNNNTRLRQGSAPTTSAELALYYRYFDRKQDSLDWLEKLYQIAAAENVILPRGAYKNITNQADKLYRYEVTLPATGSYVQLRRFIARATKEIPIMAIDGVSFKRDSIESPNVEAQIRLAFLLPGGR